MPNQCKKFVKYTTYKVFFFSVQTDVESLKRGMEIQQIKGLGIQEPYTVRCYDLLGMGMEV